MGKEKLKNPEPLSQKYCKEVIAAEVHVRPMEKWIDDKCFVAIRMYTKDNVVNLMNFYMVERNQVATGEYLKTIFGNRLKSMEVWSVSRDMFIRDIWE